MSAVSGRRDKRLARTVEGKDNVKEEDQTTKDKVGRVRKEES